MRLKWLLRRRKLLRRSLFRRREEAQGVPLREPAAGYLGEGSVALLAHKFSEGDPLGLLASVVAGSAYPGVTVIRPR